MSIKDDGECGGATGFCGAEIAGAVCCSGLDNGDAVFINIGHGDGECLIGSICRGVSGADVDDVGVVVSGIT